jgi:hypothetical protein
LDWKASALATDTGTMLPSGLKRDPGDSIFSLSRDAIRLIPMMGDMLTSDGEGNGNIKWVQQQGLLAKQTFNKTFLGQEPCQAKQHFMNHLCSCHQGNESTSYICVMWTDSEIFRKETVTEM